MEKESEGISQPIVMKFGGTSMGSAEAVNQVIGILRDVQVKQPETVVVVSAMSGVTNLLLDSALRSAEGKGDVVEQAAARLKAQHEVVIDEMLSGAPEQNAAVKEELGRLVDHFRSLCGAIAVLGEATPRALDAVACLGERMSARMLSAVLNGHGIPAQAVDADKLIVTDDRFQAALPDFAETEQRVRQALKPLLSSGKVPIVTGFMAAAKDGTITTLGRGGSDYSAAIIGAVLPAGEVWIWTDVDGVMTADPRVVPEAKTIPALSFREIAELAYFGAKVVHPKTIRPVVEAGIPVRVCNTFNPSLYGTRLLAERPLTQNGAVKAVTAVRGQSLVTIEGRGMLGVPGVAARTFSAVAATGISVPLITQASSEQSICFAVPLSAAPDVVSALEHGFETEIKRRDIDRIWASDEVVIITVVGAGMRQTPGIAGKIFSALGDQSVNVIAIAQGSSEVSISLVVHAADAGQAIRTLHGLTVGQKEREKVSAS